MLRSFYVPSVLKRYPRDNETTRYDTTKKKKILGWETCHDFQSRTFLDSQPHILCEQSNQSIRYDSIESNQSTQKRFSL